MEDILKSRKQYILKLGQNQVRKPVKILVNLPNCDRINGNYFAGRLKVGHWDVGIQANWWWTGEGETVLKFFLFTRYVYTPGHYSPFLMLIWKGRVWLDLVTLIRIRVVGVKLTSYKASISFQIKFCLTLLDFSTKNPK